MVFLSVFWFSSPSRKVCSWIFQCFRGHNLKKIATNNLGLRMVKALPFIYQPDWVTRKASDLSEADWRYQTHIKKIYIFFYTSSYGFSQGWKSLNSTIVNVINYTLNLLAQAILRNIDPRTVLTQSQINIILK